MSSNYGYIKSIYNREYVFDNCIITNGFTLGFRYISKEQKKIKIISSKRKLEGRAIP